MAAFRTFNSMRHQATFEPWLEVDLTMPQLKALMIIASWAEATDGVSGRDLGRCLGVGPSTVSALVDRLVERGLVRREEDPNDRRIIRSVPTSEGLELVGRLRAVNREWLTRVLNQLSDDELALVTAGIRVLVRTAQEIQQ